MTTGLYPQGRFRTSRNDGQGCIHREDSGQAGMTGKDVFAGKIPDKPE